MKNWKRLLALLLALTMALSLCACGSDDAAGDDNSTKKPTSEDSSGGFSDFFKGLFGSDADSPDDDAPSAEVSDEPDPSAAPTIVADLTQGPLEFSAGMSAGDLALTVDGEKIPADLFLYWLNYNCYYFSVYYGMYGLTVADYADDLLEDTVSFCVNEALLRHKAAELGCLPTDAQLQEARDSLDDETREVLKSSYGLSDSSIEYLLLSDAYYNNVMDAVTHEPSEQELDEYLDYLGVFAVKHILLKTVDDSNQPLSDEEIAAQKALADDLLSQLQKASDLEAKFDELMNEYSEDGGLATNPDGYVFSADDSLVGGFREAALELEVGGLSGVVETDYGYHIMLRLPLTDETKSEYGANFRADALNDLLQQWTDEAKIVRADALSTLDVADVFDRLMAYQQAQADQGAAESAPVESGGVD